MNETNNVKSKYELYNLDKGWADKFDKKVRAILDVVIPECCKGSKTADEESDLKHNTDIIYSIPRVNISCRVRRHKYFGSFKNEFTIRSVRPTGKSTELDKALCGDGDFMFYGFANFEETDVPNWTLIDLRKFREMYKDGRIKPLKMNNKDNSSSFEVFKLCPEIVAKSVFYK